MPLPFCSCLKLCNSFQRNPEIISVRFAELCSPLPTLMQLIRCITVLLRPAIQGLGWVIWSHITSELGNMVVVTVGVCVACQPDDGNEF